jgi:hypothetical protein
MIALFRLRAIWTLASVPFWLFALAMMWRV